MTEATPDPQGSPSEDDSTIFEISIPFSAVVCPTCDVPREPGTCPECGQEIPPPETDEHARARGRAFGPLRERITAIRSQFDAIGDGVIPTTPGQFLDAVRETEILGRAAELAGSARRLNGLDLADRTVVGGAARMALVSLVEVCEEMLAECADLGRFRPIQTGSDLRKLAIASGRYGVEVAEASVSIVAAQSYDEARTQGEHLNGLLDGFPLADAYSDTLEKLQEEVEPDLNERLGLALGVDGQFVDEDGALDMTRMLVSFAEEEQPLQVLGERAVSYFSHLFEGEPPTDGQGAILIPALSLICSSTHPLRSHSIAMALRQQLSEALRIDPEATAALIESTSAQGALIYTALGRVERVFNDFDQRSDPAQLIDDVMRAYKDITETSFRSMGWLAVRLHRINAGRGGVVDQHPPMLRDLSNQLATCGRLGQLLVDSLDVELRNAEAHSQYQWISAQEVVRDLRTGQEWTVEEIADALALLVACLAGIDAGYGCFVVEADLPGGIPEWLQSGDTPIAIEMLATICFAPYGHEIERLEDEGGTVVLKKVGSRDPARLVPPIGGLAAFTDTDTYRVCSIYGDQLIAVSAAEVRKAIHAPGIFKDLAMLDLTYQSSRELSEDHGRVDDQFAAFLAKVIGVSAMQALVASDISPTALSDIRERARWGIDFLRELNCEEVDCGDLRRRLGRIRDAAPRASHQGGVESLATLLGGLVETAEATGHQWPP